MCFLNVSKVFMMKIHDKSSPKTGQKLRKNYHFALHWRPKLNVRSSHRSAPNPHTHNGVRGLLKLYLIFYSSIISPESMSCSQIFDLSMTEFWVNISSKLQIFENWYTNSERLWHRCVKVRPRVWCKARREAKHRLFCSAPTQVCNYPDSSFLYSL